MLLFYACKRSFNWQAPTSHVKEGQVNYGHCLVKGFMPKETFCIKGVIDCYFFMCAHVFSHCSCGDILLYIARNTSSCSCSAHFLCKNDLLNQKGGERKMFCDKIMFVHLCICIYMYTNICICIITLLSQPFACKYCTFHGKGHPLAVVTVFPFCFLQEPFLSQRQSKKVL